MQLVSVIIPTYNRAAILKDAIRSVLAQSYANWELLVIDDGSVDGTKAVVEGFNDPRITYYYQKNAGPHHARNRGMEYSKGELIAYLDSDNVLYPTYLERMVEGIQPRCWPGMGVPYGR